MYILYFQHYCSFKSTGNAYSSGKICEVYAVDCNIVDLVLFRFCSPLRISLTLKRNLQLLRQHDFWICLESNMYLDQGLYHDILGHYLNFQTCLSCC